MTNGYCMQEPQYCARRARVGFLAGSLFGAALTAIGFAGYERPAPQPAIVEQQRAPQPELQLPKGVRIDFRPGDCKPVGLSYGNVKAYFNENAASIHTGAGIVKMDNTSIDALVEKTATTTERKAFTSWGAESTMKYIKIGRK